MLNRRTILLWSALVGAGIGPSALAAGFTTPAGEPTTIKAPAVVNFWATWCAPCIKELPDLAQLAKALDGEATVYLVNFGESAQVVAAFQAKRPELFGPHTLDVLDATMSGLKIYGLRGVPTTVLIHRDGTVIEAIQGLKPWGEPETIQEIRGKIGL
jgi:thiol-disulfide isomerase/thioredoxin